MSAPIQLIRLQPRRANKRGLRVAVRVALCALCLALLLSCRPHHPRCARGVGMRALLFMLTYLRNWWSFDGNHVRTKAATHMDVALRERRRRPRGRP